MNVDRGIVGLTVASLCVCILVVLLAIVVNRHATPAKSNRLVVIAPSAPALLFDEPEPAAPPRAPLLLWFPPLASDHFEWQLPHASLPPITVPPLPPVKPSKKRRHGK